MPIKKAKGVLRIEFLDSYPDQVLIANYLRSTGDAKGQVYAATKAYLYALALAKQTDASHQDLEMTLSQTIRDLDNQKSYILDYYRVFKQIELPSESSGSNGLVSSSKRIVPISMSTKVSQVEEEEEEEEEEPCLVEDFNSDATLNF